MTEIRVDLQVLRRAIERYAAAAQRAQAASRGVSAAVESASGYDGELRAQVSAIAGSAGHDVRAFSEHLAQATAELERIAQGFAAADEAELSGNPALAASLRATVDAGYDVSALPRWMLTRDRPPWISAAVWQRLAREDRADVWRWIDNAWAEFVGGDLDFSHATAADLQSAFRVHLFVNGLTSDLPAYASWQSAARAAGLSLEAYVMRVLNITPFERDTVAGVGLAETRTAGPVAMLLCEVTYINRVRDGSTWGSYETAWKGYTRVGGYDLELDGTTHAGRAYADYLADSLGGGTAQGRTAVFYATDISHYFANRDLYSHAAAATAAQDMSWRLLAGHRLTELTGEIHVTHFLGDTEAQWWEYHRDLMNAELVAYGDFMTTYAEQLKADMLEQNPARYSGNEQQLIIDVNNRLRDRFAASYPNPSTLEGATEMVEIAYRYGNQYESNPSTASLMEFRQVIYDPATMAADFPGAPSDTRLLILPKYAQMVYKTSRQLADAGLPLGDGYLDHFRSLVLVVNARNGVGLASYYFPTEDPVHLPSYP